MDLIKAIREGKITKDVRPNHGVDFCGNYENKRKVEFHNYLGSASRFLDNMRVAKLLSEDTEWI